MIFLEEIIRDKLVQITTQKELQSRYDHIKGGIWKFQHKPCLGLSIFVEYNKIHNNKSKVRHFSVSCRRLGSAVRAAVHIEERFKQLVPFPKEWAGGNEKKTLPEISGIKGGDFLPQWLLSLQERE